MTGLTRAQIDAIEHKLPWDVPHMANALSPVTADEIRALCRMARARLADEEERAQMLRGFKGTTLAELTRCAGETREGLPCRFTGRFRVGPHLYCGTHQRMEAAVLKTLGDIKYSEKR